MGKARNMNPDNAEASAQRRKKTLYDRSMNPDNAEASAQRRMKTLYDRSMNPDNAMKTKAEMVRGQQVIRKARRATSRSEARKQGYRG